MLPIRSPLVFGHTRQSTGRGKLQCSAQAGAMVVLNVPDLRKFAEDIWISDGLPVRPSRPLAGRCAES
jgi:hypothetical protein